MYSRLKERGGGGGKIMASKPQKALADDTPKAKPISRRTPIAAGKENPAAPSRRIPAAVPGVRWSTSSMPRGKSPNPPDLNPRASGTLDTKILGSRMRGLERCPQGKWGKDANLKPNLLRRSSLDVNVGKIGGKNRKDGVDLGVPKELARKCTVEPCKDKDSLAANAKTINLTGCDFVRVSDDVCKETASKKPISDVAKLKETKTSSKLEEKNSGCIKVFENSSEGSSDNGIGAVGKCPTKLHEKLAALEGRVQRIASDIKRTKEMLDLNNNHAESKLILSDIQKKISGIENAVSCVMDGDGAELGVLEIVKDNRLRAENLTGQHSNSKVLNLEELEARFFPHQKLIKNRNVSDSKPGVPKPKGSMSPIDENPIAVEFLASLTTNQHRLKEDGMSLKSDMAGAREMGMEHTTSAANFESRKASSLQCNEDIAMIGSERPYDFDDQENKPGMMVFEEAEDSFKSQTFEIGHKSSTGGWFVSEGEAVLLTHNDGSCSYYDIANSEEKAQYQPPEGVSNNLWGDCWLIRATGADGCSGRFVVAASAGPTLESGFCSWDFYTKRIQAFRVEDGNPNSLSMSLSRTALAPLVNTGLFRRNASCTTPPVESQQWWYRPCGPLLISTASTQKTVSAYDIRDGEVVMKWDVNSPVVGMEYSSPLQWRSRGKVIVTETEAVSLWDVNSLTPQPLLSIPSSGKKIYCLHVNNTDAEIGGGVRQRARSSEVEGNDGVFCTQESINVFDFRHPSGVGIRIPRQGSTAHSIFSSGDSIFLGSTEAKPAARNDARSRVQQYSLRKGKIVTSYALPDSNSHPHHSSITQVWGNSSLVMGISGMGLFVFDAVQDEPMQSCGNVVEVKERVGPDDLYCPTFDYMGSRALVISRDRPAMWRYLL